MNIQVKQKQSFSLWILKLDITKAAGSRMSFTEKLLMRRAASLGERMQITKT